MCWLASSKWRPVSSLALLQLQRRVSRVTRWYDIVLVVTWHWFLVCSTFLSDKKVKAVVYYVSVVGLVWYGMVTIEVWVVLPVFALWVKIVTSPILLHQC